jgi:hypothetical protein
MYVPRGARPPKIYRGSKRRVKRIKLGRNTSAKLWLLAGWLALLVFGLIPWLIRHSH